MSDESGARDALVYGYGWTKVYHDPETGDIVTEHRDAYIGGYTKAEITQAAMEAPGRLTISQHVIEAAKEGSAGQYRQRPVDAWQFTEANRQVQEPGWLSEAFTTRRAWGGFDHNISPAAPIMSVYTQYGTRVAYLGYWILRNHKGELSVCTATAFADLYEAI